MRRKIVYLLIFLTVALAGGIVESRIDLSSFLSPFNQINIIVPDGRGNVFVTQVDSQEFIKFKENGSFAGAAPLVREGEIKSLDVTVEGDVVVFYVRTPGLIKLGKSPWAVIFYDGDTLRKKKEVPFKNLSEIFEEIREVKALRPEKRLLIKGKAKRSGAILHVIDYSGRLLRSFCGCDTLIEDVIEREMDCFSEGNLIIDYANRIIYQIFPISGLIEAYTYKGELIGRGVRKIIECFGIEAYNGKLLLQPYNLNGVVLETMQIVKNRLVSSEEKIELPQFYGTLVAKGVKDRKLYFLGGASGKELIIYKLE